MGGMKKLICFIRNNWRYVGWNVLNYPVFKFAHCKIGCGVRTMGRVRVRNRGRIEIGDHSTINSSVMANPIGGSPCTIFTALPGGELLIGKNTGISNCAIFARRRVQIGDNVLIGAGAKIYDNDFHPVDFTDRMNKEVPSCKPVEIKDGAFIGAHCLILKGVTIGKNSVVGAGSVVTKNIPDYEVWAGNPARFIRMVEDEEHKQ